MNLNDIVDHVPEVLREGGMLMLVSAVMLLALGIGGLLALRDPVAVVRMRALSSGTGGRSTLGKVKLLKTAELTPEGLMKSLVPKEKSERVQISLQLAQAGFDSPHAVRNFFLLRLTLALIGPLTMALLFGLKSAGVLSDGLGDLLAAQSTLRIGQVCAVSAAAGFYGPGWWLKSKINARRNRIENAFPNTLDLMQISIEAGLGFDAAMARVGQDLHRVAPEIADELLLLQQEILAGRDRETAMLDMAARLGIDEARSFVNVVIQSLQYGTSLTEALGRYAIDMRINRELRAQEKANKLPVQMSGVMALLMLPALFLITLAPTIIRYLAIFDK